ncbi:MAG TPA: SDR family oxidoreductase [Actinocrinis sp.]|nr:SDR family oxidoreductase [Actinocrinis sp.]
MTTTPASPTSSPVILITGAARGLGAALAVKLSERGARLALVGLESDELSRTAAACDRATSATSTSSPVVTPTLTPTPTWPADVTDRTRMTEVADQVRAHFGRIDVVVANAGIALGGPTADTDPQAFDRVIEVNLLGSIATARALLPALVESKGYLLQIASLAAIAPAPLMAAYCASKSGVEAFAHCLRGEVAHQGVQVGVAYLTWTDTDMVRAADEDPVLKEMRSRLPWPANRTAPLAPAVERIAAGIAKRKAHVYAQPWIRPLQWLPRAAVPQAVALRGQREVARLAPRLSATSHLRQRPLGPGGAAAATATRDPHQNQVANHPPA